MPSYTTSLRLVQPATGEYPGTWGTQVNTGLTALVDTSVAGTAAITMTTADYTLSTANGASDEARAMVLNLTGTPGAARNVICPAVSKVYIVYNNTTGGFAQTVKTSAGAGISVPNGKTAFLRCDGTNVVEAVNYAASLTLGAALPTGSGGTGLTSYTSGGVVYASSTSALATGSGLVFDGSNLGIGTSSPAQRLDVSGAQNSVQARFGNVAGRGLEISTALIAGTNDAGSVLNAKGATSGTLIFQTDSTERMRLDSSGNLGLGVTPGTWAASAKAIEFVYPAFGMAANGGAFVSFNARESSSANFVYKSTDEASLLDLNPDGSFRFYTAPSGTAGNAITFTQAMTLDASGNLLVGLASPTFVSTRTEILAATNNNALGAKTTQNNYAPLMAWNSATTGDNLFQYFYTEGTLTLRGSIDYNRAGGLVRYNTTSDYRAKDILGPVANPGATIDALKVYEGRMKGATQSRPMLVAHEAQEHAPYAVSGVKDEVNEDGTPKFQQIDVSSLVPLLLAEIQTLRARVAQLESKA